jgi:regulator of protease activity HflC (stomatin/prohibitin superfamily)
MEWFTLLLLVLGGLFVLSGLKIINQYERGVVLTLGSYAYTLQPGLRVVVPIFQRVIKVDIRILTADIPKQEVITKDNVPVGINAVVYFQVIKPEDVILKIQDYQYAVTQYAQTALRDVIGGVEMDTLLTERQKIADEIKLLVDKETTDWGVDVTAIKIQDLELPQDMKRTMAKQAEAERERRATIINSEGEVVAAQNLAKAAGLMSSSPGALHLRTLNSINDISSDQSNTIVFAVPIEMLKAMEGLTKFLDKKSK